MEPLFSQIIINDAYGEPTRYLNLERVDASAAEVVEGRRRAGYYVGNRSEADQLVSTRVWKELSAVNKLRERVGRWRGAGYPGATPVTKALLGWWSRTDRAAFSLFFCQREAAETIMWMIEGPAAERGGLDEIRTLDPFVRYCCKMATGSGKTTVMAMLAAWSVINKVTNPKDARFSDAVLAVCPNLTVKERLQVLRPSHEKNDYDEKELLPAGTDFKQRLAQGKFEILNWHKLGVQTDEGKRQVTQRGEESDPAFCRRVLTEIGAKENLLVFNDEAHHAYRKNPDAETPVSDEEEEAIETEDEEEYEREATVWVDGLDRIHRSRKIRLCIDLSATPYYIARSGYKDGLPFQWIVSDFGLVDAIESGIVKVPRVPRGDDSGEAEPRYLHLWEHIKSKMPKRVDGEAADLPIMKVLMEAEGALRSLAYLYRRTFDAWKDKSEVPPCMIVVCNNTRTAEVMSSFIGGPTFSEEFRNGDGAERTLRIDSAMLRRAESDGGGADERAIVLRKKVSTVGKPGTPEESPGGQIRCVVSVAMLSEGWDARNVTQILGLRAFSSQLLCEQVVGRGLRRSSYENLLDPEFVDVYGIPFQLLPVQERGPGPDEKPSTIVRALPDRDELEIRFPRVVDFFLDVGTDLEVDESLLEPVEMRPETEPGTVIIGEASGMFAGTYGMVRDAESISAGAVYKPERVQTTIFRIATDIVNQMPEQHRPYLFKRVMDVAKRYVETKVITNDLPLEMLALTKYRGDVVNRIKEAIRTKTGLSIQLPIYDGVQREGSSRHVSFNTRKRVYKTTKSHVSHVVCDSSRDDVELERLWEYRVAAELDAYPAVRAFVKNDHLHFEIRYRFEEETRNYLPDFLISLMTNDGSELMLILEVKGEEDNRDRAKYTYANSWVAAVNRDGQYGRWAFAVVRKPEEVKQLLDQHAR